MVFPLLLAIGGAAMSAGGAMGQGKAAQYAAEHNASTLEANALFSEAERPLVVENSRNERRRLGEAYAAMVGEFRVSAAASGLDPNFGSAAYVTGDMKRAYDIDRNILARNEALALQDIDREAYNYRTGATVTRSEGRHARRAGNMSALSNLLGSASTISNMMPRGGGTGAGGGAAVSGGGSS